MKRKMTHATSLVLCLSLLMVLLGACSGNGEGQSSAPIKSSGQTAATEQKTHPILNLRISTDVNVLDPHQTASEYEYFVSMQIFDSLVKFDGSDVMTALPSLAKDWDISEDGTVYTMHLRDDVYFHSGDKFTADDVVFSVDRFITGEFTATKAPFVLGAEKIDDYTVTINLEYAYPNFILQLASWPWRMVSKNAVETYGDATLDMVRNAGTGPYKLESITPGVGLTLVSNTDYFEGAPYFETVNYKLIPDDTTALTALFNGEIDIDLVTSGMDIDSLQNEPDFNVTSVDRAGAHMVRYNITGIMANEDFRKAVAYAIDKQAFVDLVYDGKADANCISLMRDYEEGYADDLPGYDFDLEQSKAHLLASGIPESEWKFSLEVPATGYGPAFGATLKDMLSKAGITIEIIQSEMGAFVDHVSTGSYTTDAIMNDLVGIPYNPSLVFNLYFKSSAFMNLFCGNRPEAEVFTEVDELGAQASRERNDEARNSLFNQMYTIIQEKCLYVPISYIETYFGHNEKLSGMAWEPGTLCTKICDWYWTE